jgi:hypothetical protein
MQSACAILYCRMCLSGCAIFFSHFTIFYLINGAIFEKKKLLNIKFGFQFSLQILSETFHIIRSIQRDIILNVIVLHVKYPWAYSCQILKKTWIFSTYFQKIIKHQMSLISVQWKPNCPMRTYRNDGKLNFIPCIPWIRRLSYDECSTRF